MLFLRFSAWVQAEREGKERDNIKMDDEPLSGLLCQETVNSLEEEVGVNEDCFIGLKNYAALNEDDDEYVVMLLHREISFGFEKSQSLVMDNRLKCARLEAVTWILNTRAFFGFRFQTVYLSVAYFDRFLSRRSISVEQSWAIQLLSVACLSLAAKMEEVQAPALPEFQIQDYNFGSKMIQRMELLVLKTLDWRMAPVTPFAFLHHFITKMSDDTPPSHVVSRSAKLILATIREVNLMENRPSVIAAAASLVALDRRLTRTALESKMHSISYCGFLEIEEVYACYNLIKKLEMEKLKGAESRKSPDLSPTHLRPPDVSNGSSVSSAVSSKRRRSLAFNKSEESPDEKRQC